MKKRLIAMALSIVMAACSVGAAPINSSETSVQETSTVEEDETASDIAFSGETAQEVEEEAALEDETEQPDDEIENTDVQDGAQDVGIIDEGTTGEEANIDEGTTGEEANIDEGTTGEEANIDEGTAGEEANIDEGTTGEEANIDEGTTGEEAITDEGTTAEVAVIDEEIAAIDEKDAAGDAAASQTCGEFLTWELDDEGTLTISGTGKMNNYYEYGTPWEDFRDQIIKITMEEGITSIGRYAFCRCTKLLSVSIPSSVTSIGEGAFSYCTLLEQIVIPDSVNEIEYRGFYECTALKQVELSEKLSSISEESFMCCTNLCEIDIPDGVTSISKRAFCRCESLKEIVLPEQLLVLGDEAFLGCMQLSKITLPNGDYEVGESVFVGCSDELLFLDRNSQIQTDVDEGELVPADAQNIHSNNYTYWSKPVKSSLVDEGTRWLRVEMTDTALSDTGLTCEYYAYDGSLLSRTNIPVELPLYGGFFEGEDSYFLVFGQNNTEMADGKEVIRVVRYSKDWKRLSAASVSSDDVDIVNPFAGGSLSMTESDGILYIRTCHIAYDKHQYSLDLVFRTSDMALTCCRDQSITSHSFNQIIKVSGKEIISVDHGDGYPRGIVLRRFKDEAGTETLGFVEELIVLNIAGEKGNNSTGASLGALEISDSHYIVAGNSVVQDEDSYNPLGVRNIFITSTSKDNLSSSGTTTYWLTSYTDEDNTSISTPVMTALPDGRYLLMWTELGVLRYCFIGSDGTPEKTIYSGQGDLSDCKPCVKDNYVWWYVTKMSGPIFYYISIDDPEEVHIQNPSHTLVLDAMGGTLEENEIEVKHGDQYGELPVPQREAGYEFLGWYTQKNGGTKIVPSYTYVRVRPSETLYAHWKHHWSFSEDDGTLTILVKGAMDDYSSEMNSIKDLVKKVIITDGVTKLHNYAFEYFANLEEVTVAESVVDLGYYAFKGCSNLKSINIPSGVTSINSNTFSNCKNLTSISIPEGVTSIGDCAFEDCSSLTSISIPEGVTSIGSYAFEDCSSLTNVSIPSGVTNIGIGAFYGCSNLKSVTIPGGVSSIKERTFQFCSSLTDVIIEEGVTSIEFCSFWLCPNLERVTIPSSVTSIGNSAFANCTGMTSVSLPEGVTSIGNSAFKSCTGMINIMIPSSVTSIGDSAFMNCKSLSEVDYTGSESEWDSIEIGDENDALLNAKIVFVNDVNDLKNAQVEDISNVVYNGKPFTPTPVVRQLGIQLTNNEDYTISYANNINAGTASVIIKGTGKYTGTVTKTFMILPGKTTRGDMFNLANSVKVTWKAVPGAKYYKVYRELMYYYYAKPELAFVTTGLVGWDKSPELTNGSAYRYKIVASLTGKDDPSGDSPLSYSKVMYRLKTVVIRSAKNTAPGKVTVKYDKTTSGDSYVLQYSTNKDMTGAKTKVVLGAYNTSYTIGGLKKGKTYYISIRVRKKVNGISYYTTFGVARAVKVTR